MESSEIIRKSKSISTFFANLIKGGLTYTFFKVIADGDRSVARAMVAATLQHPLRFEGGRKGRAGGDGAALVRPNLLLMNSKTKQLSRNASLFSKLLHVDVCSAVDNLERAGLTDELLRLVIRNHEVAAAMVAAGKRRLIRDQRLRNQLKPKVVSKKEQVVKITNCEVVDITPLLGKNRKA